MEVKPGYKQTELGIIPEEWEVKRLGEIAEFRAGTYLAQTEYRDGEYEVHGAGSVMGHNAEPNFRKAVSVVGRVGTVGRSRFMPNGCWVNNNAAAIIAREPRGTPKFVNLLLLTVDWSKATSVTAQPFLVVPALLSMEFAVPQPDEQRAIAAALSDVDALLGGLDRLIAKKRDLKQAAMQQLLTGQTRLPGFSGAWETRKLGELVQIQKGQLITSSTLSPGDIPVIAGGKQPAYFHATANRYGSTITISASGASAGHVAFYDEPIFASDCSTISESGTYCLRFVFYQLLCKQQIIFKAQTGGAQPHIHAKDLNPILVSFPTVAEQVAIAAVISDMDAELAALEARRGKTRDIKQAMMQELLTGRTRLV